MTDTPALEGTQKIHAQLDELRTQVAELAKQMATVISSGSAIFVDAVHTTAATLPPTTYTVAAVEITLQPGELYAGLVLDATTGAPSHHLVLLPGEADDMEWEDARKWAEDQGGELPTRQEQSLLFANLKSEFKPNWYWSGEKASASSAWSQYFYYGTQGTSTLGNELRVRAVRRIPA